MSEISDKTLNDTLVQYTIKLTESDNVCIMYSLETSEAGVSWILLIGWLGASLTLFVCPYYVKFSAMLWRMISLYVASS